MKTLLILQLVLPLLLLVWIAFIPATSQLGYFCQALGTATALLGLALSGLWLFPTWWTPYLFAALLAVAATRPWWHRRTLVSRLPSGWAAWLITVMFFGVGVWGTDQSARALAGRAQQAGAVVDLAFPLKSGSYLVVNGGSNISINQHLMTLDTSIPRFQAYRGQSYGLDLVKLDEWGLRANGLLPPDPGQYNIYGEPVYAPCAGQVIAALDELPDMQVPQTDRQHMAGNHVLLRCNTADVLLGHFKPGSLKVSVGDTVAVGQVVGAVGNSGNTSEPHLHVHAQQRGTTTEPFSGNPLPMRFNGRFLVRNDRVEAP